MLIERLVQRNALMIFLVTASANAIKLLEQKRTTPRERSILYQSLQLIMTLLSKLKFMLKPMLELVLELVPSRHHIHLQIAPQTTGKPLCSPRLRMPSKPLPTGTIR